MRTKTCQPAIGPTPAYPQTEQFLRPMARKSRYQVILFLDRNYRYQSATIQFLHGAGSRPIPYTCRKFLLHGGLNSFASCCKKKLIKSLNHGGMGQRSLWWYPAEKLYLDPFIRMLSLLQTHIYNMLFYLFRSFLQFPLYYSSSSWFYT